MPRPRPFPRPTYLLVGNYGVGNAGDEILREYFLERFPEVAWRVLSACPQREELPRFPAGIRSFFSFQWLATFQELRRADGMVFGGGSLWTDSESLSACIIWTVHAGFALFLRKPIFLAFQGIGPFRTKLGEALARWVLKRASFVSVRDVASLQRRESWKMNTKVIQSFDPAFLLLDAKKSDLRIKNVFIFIPRFSSQWTADTRQKFLSFFQGTQREGGTIRILSLCPEDMRERFLCESFAHSLDVSVEEVTSLREVPQLLSGAMCVLTERYHGALAALAKGVPFVALRREKGDKLDALAEMCGCPSATVRDVRFPVSAEMLPMKAEECHELALKGEEVLRQALLHSPH